MKKIAKLMAMALAFGAALALSVPAFACEKCKVDDCKSKCKHKEARVESYAHPTMFAKDASTMVIPEQDNYVVGGKIFKAKNRIGVENKGNVYVNSFAKDILEAMKQKQAGGDVTKSAMFNSKLPILRSELALVLAEGLDIKSKANAKTFTDVQSGHWAADAIARTDSAGVMIGYPDDSFKPERAVTKAEFFAVIAQMIDVKHGNGKPVMYKGKATQYIPNWAVGASNEVVASGLLEKLPDQSRIINDEYLSKEQIAYMVGALRNDFRFYEGVVGAKGIAKDKQASESVKECAPVYISVKMLDRISARHSNIGDIFSAKTTKEVTINGKNFPCDSIVKGEVVQIQRPGLNECGFVKVKFKEISNGDCTEKFPKHISEAKAEQIKNPNFIARLLGFPFTGAARVVGVTGRTVGTGVNVIADSLEEVGDELANTFVETATLHPGSGIKSLGNAFATTAFGIYDIAKLLVSGVFGVLYEVTDEIVYLILPSRSNDSSLNPDEELVIIY